MFLKKKIVDFICNLKLNVFRDYFVWPKHLVLVYSFCWMYIYFTFNMDGKICYLQAQLVSTQ